MARSIDTIIAEIKAEKATHSELDGIDLVSAVSIGNVWIYITAVSISVFEQLLDAFKVDIESVVSQAVPATPSWIQKMLKYFQYGDTILLDDNLAFYYENINDSKKIITRSSVTTNANKTVLIKVAKGSIPTFLDSSEKSALNSYLQDILPAGVAFNLISVAGDKLEIGANIYVDSQYIDTIKAVIITAIENYLSSLDFDGKIKVSAVQDVIQGVQGVKDVVITNIKTRNTNQSYGLGSTLVSSSTINQKDYTPYAGYVIQETESGHTFTDTLVII